MVLAIITLALLGITLAAFLIGSVWLSKFAFRLSPVKGLAVLLLPPYTFYFAFYELDNDSKDRPTALWMFGLVASILLVLVFSNALRVPYFVDPTPEENSVVQGVAGELVVFDAVIFDLDSQDSVTIKLDGLENLEGAEFKPGADPGTAVFSWKTRPEDAGTYRMQLRASDFANDIERPLQLNLKCEDACKAAKAAKIAAAQAKAAEEARLAEEARKAAEAANGTTPDGTTPGGTTPPGSAPEPNNAAPKNP